MSSPRPMYAALILPDYEHLDIRHFRLSVRNALLRHDMRIGALPIMSDDERTVIGESFAVRITAEENSMFGPRIVFQIVSTESDVAIDHKQATDILVSIVLAGLARSNADMVEWLSSKCLLTREEVAELPAFRRTEAAVKVEEFREMTPADFMTTYELANTDQFVSADAKSDTKPIQPGAEQRLTAASWLMTLMIGFVSFPLAASVAIINLLRGADIRLTTQAICLAAAFSILSHHGAFDSVMTLLPYGQL